MRKQMCNIMFSALKAFGVSVTLIVIFYIFVGIIARTMAGW